MMLDSTTTASEPHCHAQWGRHSAHLILEGWKGMTLRTARGSGPRRILARPHVVGPALPSRLTRTASRLDRVAYLPPSQARGVR